MEDFCKLVETAQAGSSDAYDTLVLRFQDMAYTTAFTYLGEYALAQDVVQEAFVEAFLHLPQLREPFAFPNWLKRIVFYQCQRVLRRASHEQVPLEDASLLSSPINSPHEMAEQHELQAGVRQAIAALPAHERQVATLFYLFHYSQQELSQLLNVPVTTVKKRLYMARQHLKKHLLTLAQDDAAIIASANEDASVIIVFLKTIVRWLVGWPESHLLCSL